MLEAQATREERLAEADDVIENDGSAADLPAKVKSLDLKSRELAANR